MRTILLTLLFLMPQSFANKCEYKFIWGDAKDITEKAILFKEKNVCYIGQACYLQEYSGNIPGHLPSIGYNGHWMNEKIFRDGIHSREERDLARRYNGGMNPQVSSMVLRELSKQELKEVDSTGFIRFTEHNWMTLLLKAMQDSLVSRECEKVRINFSCNYMKENKDESVTQVASEYWDKRIEYSTKTTIKDMDGESIQYNLKKCAHKVSSIPTKCNVAYELNPKQLKDIYTNCSELFQKYASLNEYYSLLLNWGDLNEKRTVNSRRSSNKKDSANKVSPSEKIKSGSR